MLWRSRNQSTNVIQIYAKNFDYVEMQKKVLQISNVSHIRPRLFSLTITVCIYSVLSRASGPVRYLNCAAACRTISFETIFCF